MVLEKDGHAARAGIRIEGVKKKSGETYNDTEHQPSHRSPKKLAFN